MARASVAASAGLLLAVALALAGCSDAGPVAGPTITGSAYSFTAPVGWGESATPATGVEVEVIDQSSTGGAFDDRMTVVLSPGGALSPDQVESTGVEELTTAGAQDVTVLPRVTAAGSQSAHVTASVVPASGAPYLIDQYYLTHAGKTWFVTFSSPTDTPQDTRDELATGVLATWKWS